MAPLNLQPERSAARYSKTRMLKFSKVKVPLTPVRRLLRGAVAVVSRKQTCHGSHLPVRVHHSGPPATPETLHQSTLTNSYCIALLSDVSVDDAVVVSALAAAPFCCHADLLTMGMHQLTAVAQALNEALPPALHINADVASRPGELRAEIETIVGLRPPCHPRAMPVTSARPLSRYHLRPPVPYPCSTIGDPPLEDMDYDGDISMSSPPRPKRSRILPTPAPARAVGTSTLQASPSPIVFWGRLARSVTDTDVDTSQSFLTRPPLLRHDVDQGSPRMSTPVKAVQANCELTFGLEGFTVEDVGESGTSSLHVMDGSP